MRMCVATPRPRAALVACSHVRDLRKHDRSRAAITVLQCIHRAGISRSARFQHRCALRPYWPDPQSKQAAGLHASHCDRLLLTDTGERSQPAS
jgi:hypothetical protein